MSGFNSRGQTVCVLLTNDEGRSVISAQRRRLITSAHVTPFNNPRWPFSTPLSKHREQVEINCLALFLCENEGGKKGQTLLTEKETL